LIVLFAEWLNRDDPVDGVDRGITSGQAATMRVPQTGPLAF